MDGGRGLTPEHHGGRDGGARIGPNAILQMIAVLDVQAGRAVRDRVMDLAGVAVPPADAGMLPEADCRAVHDAVRLVTGADATLLLRQAGLATGDYILAHRIPAAAQALIRALPAFLGARLLATAIARHSWTFAGSGRFRILSHRPLSFEIAGNPLCPDQARHPACVWHVAVFQRLFSALVWPDADVEEVACQATGADACRFVLHPKGRAASARKTVNQS